MKKIFILTIFVALNLSACTTMSNVLNPFYEPPTEEALKGEANDHALSGDKEKVDTARQALDAMATYQRAHTADPAKPVIKPAVVRLMWIPDHLNKTGDLVPAHYYYLKVKNDQWAATDAFELEGQLNQGGSAGTSNSNIPFVYATQTNQGGR